MECRTIAAQKVRKILGLKNCDAIFTKEQSVWKNMTNLFQGENMQIQYSILGYGMIYTFMTINLQRNWLKRYYPNMSKFV